MTPYETFLQDPDRRELWLVDLYPENRQTGEIEHLGFSTDQYATEPDDDPANKPYQARIVSALDYTTDAIQPGTVGLLSPGKGGVIKLGQRSGDLDPLRDAYFWDGRRAVIRHGGFSPRMERALTYAEMGQRVYEIEQLQPGHLEMEIVIREPDCAFDHPLQERRFRGTTYALHHPDGFVVYTNDSNSPLNLDGDLTISAWFWCGSSEVNRQILSWASGSATAWPFTFQVNNARTLLFGASTYAQTVVSGLTIPAETWMHLTVIRKGTEITFVNFDEVSRAESMETLQASGLATVGDGSLFSHLRGGMISDLRVFNSALDLETIRDQRSRPLTAEETVEAVGSWTFDQALASTVPDQSGAADATVSGTYQFLPTLEGGEALQGQVKPDAWGQVENVSPKLVAPAQQIYMLAAGSVTVEAVKEGGDPSIQPVTQHATLLGFLDSQPAAGKFSSYASDAGTYIRLGSVPSKPLTVDLFGYFLESHLADSATDIARTIVLKRRKTPVQLDRAAFDTFPNDATVGLYVDTETTVRAVLDRLFRSVGAVAWHRRKDGVLTVRRFEGAEGAPRLRLTESHMRTPKPAKVEPPTWSVIVSYRRNHTPLTVDQMSANVIGTAEQLALERESAREIRQSEEVLRRHPRAREIELDALFALRLDAADEAARRLALFGQDGRAYQIPIALPAVQLDRMDVIELDYRQLTEDGQTVQRFGMNGNRWIVLAIRETQRTGEAVLTVWRES